MARTGITKAQVRACRDQLLAQGRHPSVEALRQALGSGSNSTIHRFLKELETETPQAGARRQATARTLQAALETLADGLHAGFERDVRALCADYEAALQDKDRQLAALRATVASLSAQLEGRGEPADASASAASVCGRGPSPFSIVLSSGRSDVFDIDRLGAAGLKFQ